MTPDMTIPCGGGVINIRAGAIIEKDGKILMAGNDKNDYLYTVGGRLKFGETAEEAVVREIFEETSQIMEIDRLGFIHENYFYGDHYGYSRLPVYEIAFYFYMKVPEDFPEEFSKKDKNDLFWIDPKEPIKYYPEFFRTELHKEGVIHIVNDDR